jgi:hypothetical protein
MVYAYIKNGQIVSVGKCPENTERVSNFRLLDDEDKKLHGWYKVIDDVVQIEEWQSFGQSTYELIDGEVYETKVVNSISLDEYKTKKYNELAMGTKNYVMSITPEYKQLSALAGNYPVEECDQIKAFAKLHVDAVRALKPQILNATTYEEVKALVSDVRYDYDTLEPVVNSGTTDVVN